MQPDSPLVGQDTQAPILADQSLGALQYSDPFDATWTRAETFCQEAVILIPIPNSGATANFALVDSATLPPSNAPLAPIVGPVLNATINSGSLFQTATLTTTAPLLAWSAPATGSPYGYRVTAYAQETFNGISTYQPAGSFYTSQTSVTLPPLSGGNTYVFSIAALVDGAANVQTGPFRSALPTGYATVVSAPITISTAAAKVQIHGDAAIVRRLAEPRRGK